jgi:hypothetical protein
MADYEFREYRQGDLPSLLNCFNLVFRADNPAHVDRTRAEWEYLFQRNPAGRRIWLALYQGEVVAQYAALPIKVWMASGERTFAQIVDSMVHPAHRSGLKRPGLFVQTALPFFDAYGGRERDWVHYGWPVENAWRIGKTFLKYEVVRTQTVVAREPDPDAVAPREVERLRRFDDQARWLYERCVDDFGASAIRDATYLNWRYVENPFHEYALYGVRDPEGILRGYAVYRLADWKLPRMGLIADWLVPPGEPEVGELLRRALDARATADHASALAVFLPEWSPWFERFQDWGFRVWPTDYYMVARNFHPRFDMRWLREAWWYQLGDSDLV